MFKRKRFFIIMLALGTVLIPFERVVSVKATSINEQKREKKKLTEKKKAIEEEKERFEEKRNRLQKEVEELDVKKQEIEEKIDTTKAKIKKNEKALKKIEREIGIAEDIAKDQYDTMKKRIRYMYENGETEYIDIILGSANVGELLNQTEYMTDIAEYDNSLLDKYNATIEYTKDKKAEKEKKLEELNEDKRESEKEKAENEKLSEAKSGKKSEFDALIKEADSKISGYSKQIADKEAYIDKLIAEEEAKRRAEQKRLEEERRRKSENNSGGNRGGEISDTGISLSWPLPGKSYISSGFGYRGEVLRGAGTFHSGVDIPAPAGTGIHAAAPGTVVSSGYNWSMGNYVLIDHGGGVYTVYMHSSKLLVSSGQSVSRGEQIALVGTTGMSTGPHLHFGVKINGKYVNPLSYVSP